MSRWQCERQLFLDDEWIKANYHGTVKSVCSEYNNVHGTNITRYVFNYYCKKYLNLAVRSRFYSDEEKEWLFTNYPILGEKEATERFNELFGRNTNRKAIRKFCNKHGYCVSEERTEERYKDMSSPVGTLSVNCRGEAKLKTENGWIKATHANVTVPPGKIAFNLDGNIYDNEADNIGITTNSVFRKLRNYGMWSEDREITRTGMMCCELEEALQTS